MYAYSLHSIRVEQATINARGGIELIRFTTSVVPGPGIRLALTEQSFVPVPVQVISSAAVTDSKRSDSLAALEVISLNSKSEAVSMRNASNRITRREPEFTMTSTSQSSSRSI